MRNHMHVIAVAESEDGVRQDRISGTVNWQQKSYALTSEGPHSLMWQYVKDSNDTGGWDCGWVDYVQGPGTAPPPPDLLAEAAACDIEGLTFTTGGDGAWFAQTAEEVKIVEAATRG